MNPTAKTDLNHILCHRNFVIVEFCLLFLGFPLIAWMEWFQVSIFVLYAIPCLWAAAVYFLIFGHGKLTDSHPLGSSRPWYWLRLPVIVGFLASLSWLMLPQQFLWIPTQKPQLWLIILIFYPVISVAPQEFLYRVYFFRRYKHLFSNRIIFIVSNASAFSLLHLMYDNWVAPVLTLFGGWLFASAWLHHRNFFLLWIEHSAYGLAIFTFGLGSYFYESPAR